MAPHRYRKLWPFYVSKRGKAREGRRKRDVSSVSPAKNPVFLCPSDANKPSFPEALWVTDKRNEIESNWNQLHYFLPSILSLSWNARITCTPEACFFPPMPLSPTFTSQMYPIVLSSSACTCFSLPSPSAFPILFSSSHLPPPHLSILFFTAKWTITRSVVSGVRSLM